MKSTFLLVVHEPELRHLDLVDEGAADGGQGDQGQRQPDYYGRGVVAGPVSGVWLSCWMGKV